MTSSSQNVNLERLNLGCGPDAPSNWVNVDGSWNAWFTHHKLLLRVLKLAGIINSANQGANWKVCPVVLDLRRPLPFPEGVFSAIYASHVLEHLYLVQAQALMLECKRVLKPGGVLRFVVPDVKSIVVDYLNNKENGRNWSAADRLNERLSFRPSTPPGGNLLKAFYTIWKDLHSHKWMYDADSLIHHLSAAGFRHVSEREFLKSDIAGIEEIEQSSRVLNGAGVCVEGTKPSNS